MAVFDQSQKICIPCKIYDLGLIDYNQAYRRQKQALSGVISGGENVLFLCEHPAVFTLGRLDKKDNFSCSLREIEKKNIPVVPIDRGGKITFHGQGQLLVYPIFDLNCFGKDLKFFMHQMEEVLIDFLQEFGIVANRVPGHTGAWVKDKKIASIGIGVRKWVSYHGLAVNLNTNLDSFRMIKPCGLNVEMTSLEKQLGYKINMPQAKQKMIRCFQKIFCLGIEE
ncbi:MAG: lipoyl(octanoyl) transferase LipB [Candidatus Aceula meridiana]|nr:lipoyl(octanoyl) transferase LipB [Candidatus Aceula meridiana]